MFEGWNEIGEFMGFGEAVEATDSDIDGVDSASAEDFEDSVTELFELGRV